MTFLQRVVPNCNKFDTIHACRVDILVAHTSGEGTGCCRICMAATRNRKRLVAPAHTDMLILVLPNTKRTILMFSYFDRRTVDSFEA